MDEIKNWLYGDCDYNVGIDLYHKYGKDLRLKKFVFTSQNKSASIAARLKSELAAIAGISLLKPISKPKVSEPEKPKVIIRPDKNLKKDFPEIDYSQITDARLKVLTFDRITLFKQANSLRLKRLTSIDQDERFSLLEQELEARRMNNIIWKELNHFQKTKTILGIHPVFATDNEAEEFSKLKPLQLMAKLKNIATYICKIKKAIETSKDPAFLAKKQAQLDMHLRHQDIITKLLNG